MAQSLSKLTKITAISGGEIDHLPSVIATKQKSISKPTKKGQTPAKAKQNQSKPTQTYQKPTKTY